MGYICWVKLKMLSKSKPAGWLSDDMDHTKIFIKLFMYETRRDVFVNFRKPYHFWLARRRERDRLSLTGEFEETGEKTPFTTAALRILNIRRRSDSHLDYS